MGNVKIKETKVNNPRSKLKIPVTSILLKLNLSVMFDGMNLISPTAPFAYRIVTT